MAAPAPVPEPMMCPGRCWIVGMEIVVALEIEPDSATGPPPEGSKAGGCLPPTKVTAHDYKLTSRRSRPRISCKTLFSQSSRRTLTLLYASRLSSTNGLTCEVPPKLPFTISEVRRSRPDFFLFDDVIWLWVGYRPVGPAEGCISQDLHSAKTDTTQRALHTKTIAHQAVAGFA